MLQLIGTTIETIVSIFLNVIGIAYAIGRLLAYSLGKIGEYIYNIFASISLCSVIIVEEFVRFIEDLDSQYSHFIKVIHAYLVSTVGGTYMFVTRISDDVYSAGDTCILGIQKFIQKCFDKFTWSANGLKAVFVLIGNGAWMIIMFIPNIIIYLCASLLSFIGFIVSKIFSAISLSCRAIVEAISDTISYFTSIPFQSLLGVLAICLVIKYRYRTLRLLRRFMRAQTVILEKCLTYCMRIFVAIRMLINVCISMLALRHYRRPPVGADDLPIEIDESDDNEEDEDLNDLTGAQAVLAEVYKNDELSNLCVICQDRQKSVVLMPCRHLCLCRNCFHHLRSYRAVCPLCRKAFRDTIQVYV